MLRAKAVDMMERIVVLVIHITEHYISLHQKFSKKFGQSVSCASVSLELVSRGGQRPVHNHARGVDQWTWT